MVGLGELAGADAGRQRHSELLAHEAAVHDVVRVFVRQKHGRQEVFALVEMLGDAPLLEAEDERLRKRTARLLALEDVDVSVTRAGDRLAGERIDDAPDVHVLDVAEETREVEEDVPHARIADLAELGIARAVELVPERIEDQLAAVDARARQPLNLTEELGRDALDELALVRRRVVRARGDRRAHRIAPLVVLHRLLAELGGDRHAPFGVDPTHRGAQRRVVQRVDGQGLELLLDVDRRRRREEVDLGMAHAVAPLQHRLGLLQLRAQLVGRQRRQDLRPAHRHVARAGEDVVVVDRLARNGHLGALDQFDHVLLRNRHARHAPVLAARTERVADLRRMRVEETDLPLGDELL